MFYAQTGDLIEGEEISLRVEGCYSGGKDWVPTYKFDVILNGSNKKIGHLNVRTEINHDVEFYCGQIGYSVDEEFRGNNYARKACLVVKELIRKHNSSYIITCNPDNIPSIRTTEKLGAKFIEMIDVPSDKAERHEGKQKNRYIWKLDGS